MPRVTFRHLTVLAALALPAPAAAQDTAPDQAAAEAPALAQPGDGDAGATPFAGLGMYKAFHERAGIERITADLVERNVADPRISDIFKNQELPHLKLMLADQFCFILGGPCKYTGKGMKTAHQNMGVRQSDFNALVENLQKAMDKEGVPFRAQNRLLAKLAPQARLVIER